MNFLRGEIDNPSITAVSHTKIKGGQVIALGEKQFTDSNGKLHDPRVIIYNPKKDRKKVLNHRHLGTEKEIEIIQIVFSSNPSKYCLTLTRVGKNDIYANYYLWNKESLILSKQIAPEVRRVTFNPTDENEFVACGNKYLRYYVIKEGKMKEGTEIKRSEERVNNYVDAQFFPNTPIFLAVSERLIGYIIQDSIVKYKLSLDHSSSLIASLEEQMMNKAIAVSEAEGEEKSTGEDPKKALPEDPQTEDDWRNKKPLPQCLAIGSKRFAIGWRHKGMVGIYEIHLKDPENIEILLTKVFSLGDDFYDIHSLEFNANQEYLGIAGRRPVYQKKEPGETLVEELLVTECYLVNVPEIEASQARSMLPFKQLIENGNTFGQITNVSVATLRHYIATVGTDKYIRIWDYTDGKFKQISNTWFETDLNDVALHPAGHQMAVGANEGIRIFYVLEDEAKLAVDISGKQCMAVQYSHGGHWLAAGFAYQVYVIDPNTFETKFVLGPHRSTVTRLSWTPNDYSLTSSCRGGTAFVWSSRFEIYTADAQNLAITEQSEEGQSKALQSNKYEFVRQNIQFTGAIYDDEYDLLVVVGADRVMEMLTDKANKQYLKYKFEEHMIPTCMCLCKESQVLLVGTNVGVVRAFLWPLPPKGAPEIYFDFHDYKVHAGEITGLKISADSGYVITSSKDGTVAILKTTELWEGAGDTGTGGAALSPDKKRKLKKELGAGGVRAKVHETMDSLSLSMRHALRDMMEKIERLKEEKKGAEEMAEERIHSLRKELDREVAQLKTTHVKALDEEHNAYRRLQEQYEAECRRAENEKARILEEHNKELEEMDEKHKKEQRIAFDLNNEKIELLEKQKAEFRDEIDGIQRSLKDQLEKIEATYQSKYDELKAQHNELLKRLKIDGIKFEEALEQCEQEYEKEIENIKKAFYTDLRVARDNNEVLKKDIEKAEKDIKETTKTMEETKEQKKSYQEKAEELKIKKAQLETKVKEVEEQLKQRELIIREKEKEIKNLRNTNSHLENFRFVLDHKIISLKDEKLPMEEQIKNLEKQVNEMYQELERETETTRKLIEDKKSCEAKLENAKVQIKVQSEEVHITKRRLELLQYDMINVLKEPVDAWPSSLTKVYSTYFGTEEGINVPENLILKRGERLSIELKEPKGKKDEETTRVRDELVKHREWLENKLKSVKRDSGKREMEKTDLIKKLQRQNTELINDANKLRRDYDNLKVKVKQLEEKFKELTGISLTNVEDIEKEIKKFIHPGAIRSTTHRLSSEGNKKIPSLQKSASSFLQYYSKMSKKPQEEEGKQGGINSLLGDLQRNKYVIEQQNAEMSKLQV
eukprot:TRINITY_DN4214_c0_g2_i1.p1 TRINITY_DN4214_c0_g2~~TRINITY_DN4214_c0_g2_i1.p1  ORF type:complete len:1332 (-),score=238.62 TRINITY_DN4214_c0_g2_i1:10010-14005(-)